MSVGIVQASTLVNNSRMVSQFLSTDPLLLIVRFSMTNV